MTEAATIGHNSAGVGEMLAENPKLLFTESGMLESLIEEIEAEVSGHKPNLETEAGRKSIASLAYSIARRKTAFDEAGKALNEDHRKAINEVDAVRRDLRTKLDALKDKARQPLNEWEQAEEDRKAAINEARILFAEALSARFETVEDAEDMRQRVVGAKLDPDVFGDLYDTANSERGAALDAIDGETVRLKQLEAERAELEKLRAEKEERERAERETAEKEAAAKAEQERIEAERKKAADEATAEANRRHEAAVAEERRKADAAQAELDRQKREREEAEAAKAKREADQAHRSKIMKAAKEAIMEHGEIEEAAAKAIVLAAVAGSIPNVEVRF